ncbi:MAG TPA: hypothetical protein EYH31_02110, partial [Anaerolineae bacterium]|nr:hypothetical protein [Anaerolineae bacterium]
MVDRILTTVHVHNGQVHHGLAAAAQGDLHQLGDDHPSTSPSTSLYQALKGSRWVLLKRRRDLKPEEETKLRILLNVLEELRSIYLLKEEFITICDKMRDRSQAERFLQAWTRKAVATGSRYLIRFVKTLENWWHEFLNYFIDRVT